MAHPAPPGTTPLVSNYINYFATEFDKKIADSLDSAEHKNDIDFYMFYFGPFYKSHAKINAVFVISISGLQSEMFFIIFGENLTGLFNDYVDKKWSKNAYFCPR